MPIYLRKFYFNKLLDSLIVTKGVSVDDLIIGDKNAIMVAARILAYGPEYTVQVTNPNTGNLFEHTFDLTDCEFKNIPDDISGNEFEVELPYSKIKIKFKLLTGHDESNIDKELESYKNVGNQVSPELTTRLKYTIVSVSDNNTKSTISNFVDNMLSRDSLFLRSEIKRVSPDIDLTQEIEIEGETVTVTIPMAVNFFWPDSES